MSKQSRRIAARGLTRSNVGSVIEYWDGRWHKVRLESVSYNPTTATTLVTHTAVVALEDLQEVIIWDV